MKIGDLLYQGKRLRDITDVDCENTICVSCKLRGMCGISEFEDLEVELPQEVIPTNAINPEHYKTGKFECIEVMAEALGVEAVKDFCICNAFKYLYRHKRKNGLEDIKKAQWYINKYIELNNKEDEKCKS